MPKNKKVEELEQQIGELTQDLQRVRADFENYRKQGEQQREMAKANGRVSAIMQLIPVIDNIERAVTHVPSELKDNTWAQGIVGLSKQLEKSLADMNVSRIKADKDEIFNPELHNAVQFDEEAEGDKEIIAEELQTGYMLGDDVIRPSMVRVTRR